jgi:PAS domain-containing protein
MIENWNAGVEFIKGYSSEEIVGKDLIFSILRRIEMACLIVIESGQETGKAPEGWRVRKDGDKILGV